MSARSRMLCDLCETFPAVFCKVRRSKNAGAAAQKAGAAEKLTSACGAGNAEQETGIQNRNEIQEENRMTVERQMLRFCIRNRWCDTLSGLNRILLAAAVLPIALRIASGLAMVGMALYLLVLILFVLLSLFLLLLSEDFRGLFDVGAVSESIQLLAARTDAVYRTAMPMILCVSGAVSVVTVVLLSRYTELPDRKRRIVLICITEVLILVFALLFYRMTRQEGI